VWGGYFFGFLNAPTAHQEMGGVALNVSKTCLGATFLILLQVNFTRFNPGKQTQNGRE